MSVKVVDRKTGKETTGKYAVIKGDRSVFTRASCQIRKAAGEAAVSGFCSRQTV